MMCIAIIQNVGMTCLIVVFRATRIDIWICWVMELVMMLVICINATLITAIVASAQTRRGIPAISIKL